MGDQRKSRLLKFKVLRDLFFVMVVVIAAISWLPDNASAKVCLSNGDCDSDQYCNWGTCASRGSSTDSCTGIGQGTCKSGMVCDFLRGECRHQPGQTGEVCSDLLPCASDLACNAYNDFFRCEERGDSTDSCSGIGQGTCKPGLVCDVLGECRTEGTSQEGEICALDGLTVPCADGLTCWPGAPPRCIDEKTVGEACVTSANCEDDLICATCVSPQGVIGGDGCQGLQVCFPPTGEHAFDTETCLSLYSSGLHQLAQSLNATYTYGTGVDSAAGISAVIEAGTLYGPDDRYGCYQTQCLGAKTNASAEVYFSTGWFVDYGYVAGKSAMETLGGGEVVNAGVSTIHDTEFSEFYGYTSSISLGISVIPVDVGIYYCETFLNTVMGNSPPFAVCKDATICADAINCSAEADINNGSYDPDGDAITLSQTPASPYSIGNSLVTLTVDDPNGASDSCDANVSIEDCTPPEISCPESIVAECDSTRQAEVDPGEATATDSCSSVTVNDPGTASYPLGDTVVTYTATDSWANFSSCSMTVSVVDTIAPEISCNSSNIVPPDAPISFNATAIDSCDNVSVIISDFDCFKFTPKGKRIDKTGSCVIEIDGSAVNILDSGGVGNNITWTVVATDPSGNSSTNVCAINVGNPGQNDD